MRTPRLSRALLALPFVLSSCATSRWYDYSFSPAPLETEPIRTEAVPGSLVRALVSVLGIERGRDGSPDRAVGRMRLENLGTASAELVPEELELVSADLATFGPATVTPAERKPIGAGESAVFDWAFPFPEGKRAHDLNLRGLNLRWTVAFGEHKVRAGASFERTDWRRWDDSPRVHVGFGFGVVHTR